MVEKLSKEQQAEYAEDIEYYEDNRSKPAKKRHEEPDWDTEIHSHEKQEKVRAGSEERREREEMREEMEYHEQYHQAPREKARKESSAPDYEVHQPGHGQTVFLSPFEISEYKEEIEYRGKNQSRKKEAAPLSPRESMGYELSQPGHGQTLFLSPFEISQYKEEIAYGEKNHPRSKPVSPLSPLESMGFEMGYVRHGEKGSMKSMPEGMMGYDLEVGYFHNVSQRNNPLVNPRGTEMFAGPIGPERSRGRRVTDALRGVGEGILEARDSLYGYRRISKGPYTNEWKLDIGSVNRSTVGRIDFFRDTRGRGLMSMDPFHLSGHTKAKPGRKKRGRPANSRRSGGNINGLPDSLAWMF